MQHRTIPTALAVLIAAFAVLGGACSSPADPGSGDANGSPFKPVDPGTKPDTTPDQRDFLRDYEVVRAEARDMTPAQFKARYPAPTPANDLGYDPLSAGALDAIDERLQLTGPQREALGDNGFVVLGDETRATFEDAYGDLYDADLPVLVTTDSILYAIHRSYDSILQDLEERVLVAEVQTLLEGMHTELGRKLDGGLPASLNDAALDADLYLAVARSLLTGAPVAPLRAPQAAVDKILGDAEGLQPAILELFGLQAPYDYSQMKPRGHYTDSEVLQRYFRTMIWLGRTEAALVVFEGQTPLFNRRALNAAVLFNTLMNDGSVRPSWDRVNLVIERMVGERDSMDVRDLDAFQQEQGLTSLDALASASDEDIAQALLESPYGIQRIMSQIIYTDPNDPTIVLPRVFLLMGQRFVIDSYVFHHVTYDRLVDPKTGTKIRRMLPSGLDVSFALGNNAARDLLQPEVEQYGHQGTLHEVRFLVESHPAEFWDANLYNGWLDTLRSLNDDADRDRRPAAMRTAAWEHKTLNTQLASWAELRHDTILYAKQSYSAGVGCMYPDAWVEAYPAFFNRVGHLADLGITLTDDLTAQGFDVSRARAWFDNLAGVASTLEAIAHKELNQEPLSEDEWNFLRATIEREMVGCGEIAYDGWYGTLFFNPGDVGSPRPTIADVHTAPTDADGNPTGWVLHAATGFPQLMVFTLSDCEGTRAYVGPVSSYYDVLTENFLRHTDEEWLGISQSAERPAWTTSFIR